MEQAAFTSAKTRPFSNLQDRALGEHSCIGRLKLGKGQLLGRALDLLQLRDKGLSKSQVQAWTSAVHAQVSTSGSVTTHRLDFLIGSPAQSKGASHHLAYGFQRELLAKAHAAVPMHTSLVLLSAF